MKNGIALIAIIVLLVGGLTYGIIAWMDHQRNRYNGYSNPGNYGPGYSYGPVEFKDDVTTNFDITADKLPLTFIDREGKNVRLQDYQGKKNLVLVFMRGVTKVPGGICPTCSTQTSRLLTNYAEFVKRDSEVLIVYPGDRDQGQQFVTHILGSNPQGIPFPVLIDNNFQAVDRLGIRGDAARPSTFLLNKKGEIRFAYVGETTADRPSLKAIYQQLDALAAETP